MRGGFGYCWFLPFKSGAIEIKSGDIINGAGGAIAVVTDVLLLTGTWAGGTANGYLYLETKSGTFVDSEVITRQGSIATMTINAGGLDYVVGDSVEVVQTGGAQGKAVVTGVEVNCGGRFWKAATVRV